MTDSFHSVLILSDFDGTFTDADGRPHSRNLEAVARFRSKGGLFSFSTGRFPSVLSKIFPDFRCVVNAPVIMGNGSLFYDAESGLPLAEIFFDGIRGRAAARDILKRFPGSTLTVYSDDGLMRSTPDPDTIPGDRWRKMRFVFGSAEEAVAGRDYLRSAYGDFLNVFRSWHNITEAVDRSVSKSRMIGKEREWAAARGIPALTVIGIGDFENDADMLSHADLAFCPENAIEPIRTLACRVLCHHRDGAVAELIELLEAEGLPNFSDRSQ